MAAEVDVEAARRKERKRIHAIMSAPVSLLMPDVAYTFAFKTQTPAAEAIAIMEASTKGSPEVATKSLADQIILSGKMRRGEVAAPVTAGPKTFVKTTAEEILAAAKERPKMTERTESELAEAYESERSALAGAQEEIKGMQKHRLTLLRMAGTPEDVLSLDDEIRLEGIKIEIASARLSPMKVDLDQAPETTAKWAGVDMPSADELDSLYKIVIAAHPGLNLERKTTRFEYERNHQDEFKRAFFAVGRMGRLSEPSDDRYFHAVVDDVNRVLNARRLSDVGGNAACARSSLGATFSTERPTLRSVK